MKYLIVAVEYFTKWIEAEPVAQITAHKVQRFVWKNIVCRFGVPRQLVQWHPVCKPTVEKSVRGGRHQAGVRISRTPPDKWASRVSE